MFLLVGQSLIKETFPCLAFKPTVRGFNDDFQQSLPLGVDLSLCSAGIHSIKMIFHSYNPLHHIITFFCIEQQSLLEWNPSYLCLAKYFL